MKLTDSPALRYAAAAAAAGATPSRGCGERPKPPVALVRALLMLLGSGERSLPGVGKPFLHTNGSQGRSQDMGGTLGLTPWQCFLLLTKLKKGKQPCLYFKKKSRAGCPKQKTGNSWEALKTKKIYIQYLQY